jgi:hypothetical protein
MELCPKGIDIFFDDVWGAILDAALARLAMRRTTSIWSRSVEDGAAEATGTLAGWMQAGKIKTKVDVQHGLEDSHILEPISLASPIQTQRSSITRSGDPMCSSKGGASPVEKFVRFVEQSIWHTPER